MHYPLGGVKTVSSFSTAESRIFHEMCINEYLLLFNELPSVAYHMKGLKELNILEQVAIQSVEA